jgi:uncharacterized RDD family membrane protein YckC
LPESAAFCPRCGAPAPLSETPGAPHGAAPPSFAPPPASPPPSFAPQPGVVTVASYTPYAGFWRRFVAVFLDGLILTFITFPINLVMHIPMFGWMNGEPSYDEILTMLNASLGAMALATLVAWLYYALLESSRLQGTLGKVALNICVTDLAGRRISFGRASGRYFSRWITNLTIGIGYLIQLFTRRRQALHDLIAGTVIVRRSGGG